MNIAIIPARSGSKRIKNKNIKNFLGKPIIYYTIKKLKFSKLFDKIFVSTDSNKIANISKKYGAEVPFLRSKSLSNDYATTIEVIRNFVDKIKHLHKNNDIVCCVYPCTPLLNTKDIKKGIDLFYKQKKNFVYPVLRYKHPIQRSFSMNKNGSIKFNFPHLFENRTQDLKSSYHDAGQFYISTLNNWSVEKNMHKNATCFEVESRNAIDIDDQEDWFLAERLFKIQKK